MDRELSLRRFINIVSRKRALGTLITVGFSVITAAVILLLCSRSSFLYPYNDWNDANSYFTMGKGLMNGLVLYRDLYDQKGPYLYLIYGIAYLLSHTTFHGVYFLEIVAGGIFLSAACFTMQLFMKRRTSYLLLPLLAMLVYTSKSFYWGGAAEEFMLPMLGLTIYLTLKHVGKIASTIKQGSFITDYGWVLACGIFAGIIMLIKFNVMGFYMGWCLLVGLPILFRREWKALGLTIIAFAAGVAITFVPWLCYFALQGALGDWYTCYVYNNVFLYSNFGNETLSVGTRVYELTKALYWLVLDNLGPWLLMGMGLVGSLFIKRMRRSTAVGLLGMAALTYLGIYVGGASLPYYAIPFLSFSVLGMILIGMGLDKLLSMGNIDRMLDGAVVAVFMLSAFGCLRLSMNDPFMEQSKEEFYIYRLQEAMDVGEDTTLLNAGCLDAGLFTATGIVPNVKFFQTNAIPYDTMLEEQKRYMEEGVTEYVLLRNDEKTLVITDLYEKVAEAPYDWKDQHFIYTLYRLKAR